MTRPTDLQQRAWMAQWRSAAIALAQMQQSDLVDADLTRIASDLDDACIEAARARGSSQTSGLIEQQRLFAKLRHP